MLQYQICIFKVRSTLLDDWIYNASVSDLHIWSQIYPPRWLFIMLQYQICIFKVRSTLLDECILYCFSIRFAYLKSDLPLMTVFIMLQHQVYIFKVRSILNNCIYYPSVSDLYKADNEHIWTFISEQYSNIIIISKANLPQSWMCWYIYIYHFWCFLNVFIFLRFREPTTLLTVQYKCI